MATDICSAFRKNADGSWTCIKPVTLQGPNGKVGIGAGASFARGSLFMGLDVAAWLDQNCK
jgi:hypothetical protein